MVEKMEYSKTRKIRNILKGGICTESEQIVNSPISFYSYTFKQILNHATKNKKVTKTNTINKPRGFEGNYITSANPCTL